MKQLIVFILLTSCAPKQKSVIIEEPVESLCLSLEENIPLKWSQGAAFGPVQVDLCQFESDYCLLFQALDTGLSALDCSTSIFEETRTVL